MRKKTVGLFEVGIIAACAGFVAYAVWHGRQAPGGVSLWSALGYPYGPIGNLAGIGSDFKTGPKALPLIKVLDVSSFHVLTDSLGVALTDAAGVVLTDSAGAPYVTQFPSRNAAGIRDSFNHRGTRPA